MYIVTISKQDKTIELVIDYKITEDNISKLIEENFLPSSSLADISSFYMEFEKYIQDVDIKIEEHGYPRIWEFQTDARGYDTYDSGVFIAWTENRARNIAEEISADFYMAHVECIGVSNKVQEECVRSSFNAG